MGRGHGGEGGAELRADGAQGGELRAGARRDGRHPLRALDAPRMVQGRRRPPLPPPGPMVYLHFYWPGSLYVLVDLLWSYCS